MIGDETTRVRLVDAVLVEHRELELVDAGDGQTVSIVTTRRRWVEATLGGMPVRLDVLTLEER